jgi:hypothetical protein
VIHAIPCPIEVDKDGVSKRTVTRLSGNCAAENLTSMPIQLNHVGSVKRFDSMTDIFNLGNSKSYFSGNNGC